MTVESAATSVVQVMVAVVPVVLVAIEEMTGAAPRPPPGAEMYVTMDDGDEEAVVGAVLVAASVEVAVDVVAVAGRLGSVERAQRAASAARVRGPK